MDKHIRNIKKTLNMPNLNIASESSEKEKGIQVADALAGVVSREYCCTTLQNDGLFKIVKHLLQKEVLKI